MHPNCSYPGFPFHPADLYKFKQAATFFTIMLKEECGGEIIHFEPTEPEDFKAWLTRHKVIDIGSVDPKSTT